MWYPYILLFKVSSPLPQGTYLVSVQPFITATAYLYIEVTINYSQEPKEKELKHYRILLSRMVLSSLVEHFFAQLWFFMPLEPEIF